jgi:hypothetical protein
MTAASASASCSSAAVVDTRTFDAGERSLGMFKTQNGAVNKIQLTANEKA